MLRQEVNLIKFENEQIIVYDNFLPQETFIALREEARRQSYELIPHGDDIAYKLNTGNIYKTINKQWRTKQRAFHKWFDAMDALDPVPCEDYSVMVHNYCVGSEIDWHKDYSSLASYSFYLHEQWLPQWGGNLLVADYAKTVDVQGNNGTVFDNNPSVMNPGFGTFYAPKPNRLVIIKDVFHKVERIDQSAGNNVRMSFTGFFK
jgi:hypothetical protein